MLIDKIVEKYENQGHDNPWSEDWLNAKNSAFMCAYPFIAQSADLASAPNIMGVVEYWKDDLSDNVWAGEFAIKGKTRETLETFHSGEVKIERVTTPMVKISISQEGIQVESIAPKVDVYDYSEVSSDEDPRDNWGSMWG